MFSALLKDRNHHFRRFQFLVCNFFNLDEFYRGDKILTWTILKVFSDYKCSPNDDYFHYKVDKIMGKGESAAYSMF